MASTNLSTQPQACSWPGNDPLYRSYHDEDWGRPVFDSRELFEKLCLDGQQAGLSWITILRKRENYRRLFAGFDPDVLVQWGETEVAQLLLDPGIVRNRLKVQSIIKNAKAYLVISQQRDFAEYLWSFVGYQQINNALTAEADAPTSSPESDAMAKALKKAGFSFVGTTICYAFMQAVGMVNDHLVSCPQYQPCLIDSTPWRE